MVHSRHNIWVFDKVFDSKSDGKMKEKDDEVLRKIKEVYDNRGSPIPIGDIYSHLRHMKKNDIKSAIVFLKNNGFINFEIESTKITPIYNGNEKEVINAVRPSDRKVEITEIRIKNAIVSFFRKHNIFPTQDEMSTEFIITQGYAMKASIEREGRNFAEENEKRGRSEYGINRTEDGRYYTKVSKENGLGKFLM